MDEERLEEIEIKLAYHEKTIRDLNDVIFDQQKKIERLDFICEKLTKLGKEYEQMASIIDAPANEKPPHY